jgi:hypothetical protein
VKLNPKPGYDEGELLRNLSSELGSGSFSRLGIPPACKAQIAATLQILEPFEQFYQSVMFLFERIRGAASDEFEVSLADLARTEQIDDAGQAIRKSAIDLGASLQAAREVDQPTTAEVEAVLRESGILALADDVLRLPTDATEAMRIVLRRHTQVQSGKFDKGLPKAAWTRLTEGGDRVRLTAQRHQSAASQRPADWTKVGRHPYRTDSAFAFNQACNIS